MKNALNKRVCGVSLLTGMLMLTTAPASAQVVVTGGRITGDAGVFVPTIGNTILFDSATQTLRLETPNGVTVDSRFTPTFGSLEPIGNRIPVTGDRGNLTGNLAGRAFDLVGAPFFFGNIPTTLNFTLNSFSANQGNLAGTLLAPSLAGAGTSVFLPVVGTTLDPISEVSFDAIPGTLVLGDFDANLPNGLIGLPADARFGTPLQSEFAVPDAVITSQRPLNFQLQGSGIPDPFDSIIDPFTTGRIRFSSVNALTNFNIQLDGTPLTISGAGNFGTLIDITGVDPFTLAASSITPGSLTPIVDYSVSGVASGSATTTEPLRFGSDVSSTNFSFTDTAGAFLQGRSAGSINFQVNNALPFTTSSFTGVSPNPAFNAVTVDSTGIFTPASVIAPPSLVSFTIPTGSSSITLPTGQTVTSSNQPIDLSNQPSISTINSITAGDAGVRFNPSSSGLSGLPVGTVLTQGPGNTLVANVPVGPSGRIFPGQQGFNQIPVSSAQFQPLGANDAGPIGSLFSGLNQQLGSNVFSPSGNIVNIPTSIDNATATSFPPGSFIPPVIAAGGPLGVNDGGPLAQISGLLDATNAVGADLPSNTALLGNLLTSADQIVQDTTSLVDSLAPAQSDPLVEQIIRNTGLDPINAASLRIGWSAEMDRQQEIQEFLNSVPPEQRSNDSNRILEGLTLSGAASRPALDDLRLWDQGPGVCARAC